MEVDGTLRLNVAQWQMGMTFNYCSTPFTPRIPYWPKMEKKGQIIYLIQFHNRWSILNLVYYLIQLQDLYIYWFMINVDFFPSNQFKRKMHQSHNIKRIALQTMGYPIIQARFLDLRSLKITDCEISKTCVPNNGWEVFFLNQVPYPRLQPLDMGLWILPTKKHREWFESLAHHWTRLPTDIVQS